MSKMEKILNRTESYYIPEYKGIFEQELKLIEKIKSAITGEEFEVLYRMINEEEYELYKIIKYLREE